MRYVSRQQTEHLRSLLRAFPAVLLVGPGVEVALSSSVLHAWRRRNTLLVDAGFLVALLSRRVLIAAFDLDNDVESVLKLLQKYADVPMRLADACLVRMTETLPDPVLLTTDSDFRIDRRHSRPMVPCRMPS